MSAIVVIDRPYKLDLTEAWLTDRGFKPLYGGTDWIFRVHYTDQNGDGVDLTGATTKLTITDGTTTITRTNGVTSTGASHAQVVYDDQTSEDPVAETGTGWLTIYCHAVAAEVTEFAPILASISAQRYALCPYELATKFGGGFPQGVVMSGRIEVYKPLTTFPM